MVSIRARRNQLAYPAGAALGFDPTHVALSRGGKARLSAVVGPGNSGWNALNGQKGTVGGSPTAQIDGRVGPSAKIGANADRINFTVPAVQDTLLTLAGIFRVDAVNTFADIITTSSTGNTGWYIALNTSSDFLVGIQSGNNNGISGTFNVQVGHAYFLVVSIDNTTTTAVVKATAVDFGTGQTWTGSTSSFPAGQVSGASDGTAYIGGGTSGLTIAAAAVIGGANLSLAEQAQWAKDPWSFWYPSRLPRYDAGIAGAAARGLFINSTLTGLGAGGSFFPDRLAS